MKTITYKLLIATFVIIFFLTVTAFRSGGSASQFATMTVWELPGGAIYDSKILIIYEDGKTEEIELKASKPNNWVFNKTKIVETLNNMSAKGYELFSVDNSNYVFKKN